MSAKDQPSPATVIESLEEQLAELAIQFRMQPDTREAIVAKYDQIIRRLLQYPEWSGEPDVDSQLPDEFMPEAYKRYWDKRLASVVSIIQDELGGSDGIRPRCSADTFSSELATVIQATNLEFGLPQPNGSDRIPTACRQLGRLAIFLSAKLEGDMVSGLIWRICKRVLWLADIELDEKGQQEFTEKLPLSGVSHVDVREMLEKYCQALPVATSATRAWFSE